MRVTTDEFEALVARALEQLPPEFGEALENVAVVVEDEPTPDDLAVFEDMANPDELLGIYRGLSLVEREFDYCDLPAQVVLFRGPLTRYCRDRRELIREVKKTVFHELAHYFGFEEDDIPPGWE